MRKNIIDFLLLVLVVCGFICLSYGLYLAMPVMRRINDTAMDVVIGMACAIPVALLTDRIISHLNNTTDQP